MHAVPIALLAVVASSTFTSLLPAQIPLPDYGSTFSSSATRGYFFQAPSPFVVTGLQVPDEKNAGAQVVALYKMPSAPPQYSATIPVTPVFYAAVQNNDVIPVTPPAVFQTGDWVGVLGGAGPTTGTIHNSYGAGNYPSLLLGQPITLLRMLMQTNIGASNGVGNVSAEGTASIARVRIFVAGQGQAVTYGKSSGTGSLAVVDPSPPSTGQTGAMNVLPGAGSNMGGVLAVGTMRASVPTPFGDLLTLPLLTTLPLANPIPGTGQKVSLPIPNDAALHNAIVTFQAAILANSTLTLTNGLEWTVGQ